MKFLMELMPTQNGKRDHDVTDQGNSMETAWKTAWKLITLKEENC